MILAPEQLGLDELHNWNSWIWVFVGLRFGLVFYDNLEIKAKKPNPKITISVLCLMILAWVWRSRHQSGLGLMNYRNGTCGFRSSWGCVLVWFSMNCRNWNSWIGYRSSGLVFDELHKLEVWNSLIVSWSGTRVPCWFFMKFDSQRLELQ